jgi:8-oxo-dGTP pyrophosphatase MutT (NUDIX family)
VSSVPAVEVGVVDVVVFRPAERGWLVLALQRGPATRCPGSWEIVHGKIEPGEAFETAALRELREETGLEAERLLSITMHSFYLMPRKTVQHAAVFAAVVPAASVVKLGEEHCKFAWLTVSQARRRLVWPQEKRSLDDARALLNERTVHDVIAIDFPAPSVT